eukprot:CAMPEP_0171459846 /NCGR_PEP_ID=MMETSP0945-20130129/4959_1 /TAXON_ID=109269 /ORGANISM="Vaucheria litorea, Strain CCMP2940" /LENGTH=323 /DNA_ID=CAMNT_0011985931 /DNA_START=181 /DNA_END=1152 /DNA_ORIENTATION=+
MVPELDEERVSVLFDFDGTIGDTETPAMKVAYWEIAPYLCVEANDLPGSEEEYVRNNAGKAFEFMMEECDKTRKAKGLATIEEAYKAGGEDPAVMDMVNTRRSDFGLPPIGTVKYSTLLEQQKEETVISLSKVARPVDGIVAALKGLKENGIAFAISTTSPKPRVPVSVESCGLSGYFPPDKIHSGESDFDPPRFKPAPDVYLRAAAHEGAMPERCVAVEDSESGVGSASNANIGLIIGYVGASHVPSDRKAKHAGALIAGTRAKSGRGAEIVLADMNDLLVVVKKYVQDGKASSVMQDVRNLSINGGFWHKNEAGEVEYFKK